VLKGLSELQQLTFCATFLGCREQLNHVTQLQCFLLMAFLGSCQQLALELILCFPGYADVCLSLAWKSTPKRAPATGQGWVSAMGSLLLLLSLLNDGLILV
jgi:hypothetical protein